MGHGKRSHLPSRVFFFTWYEIVPFLLESFWVSRNLPQKENSIRLVSECKTVSWSYTCECSICKSEKKRICWLNIRFYHWVNDSYYHITCVHPRLSYFQRHLKIVKLLKKLRCVIRYLTTSEQNKKNVWSLFELLYIVYQLLKNSEGDEFLLNFFSRNSVAHPASDERTTYLQRPERPLS